MRESSASTEKREKRTATTLVELQTNRSSRTRRPPGREKGTKGGKPLHKGVRGRVQAA